MEATTARDMKDISESDLIKNFLDEEKMSPKDLASSLNVNETTVLRWLKGEAKPTGTAAAILWTVIGIGGLALGAAAPAAINGASAAARLLKSASIGMGAISSGIGIYKLLRRTFERVAPEGDIDVLLDEHMKMVAEKQERERRIKDLRDQLAKEEVRLREIEERLSGQEQ
jgi:hypothetical protein